MEPPRFIPSGVTRRFTYKNIISILKYFMICPTALDLYIGREMAQHLR
jgi:hypothetical protein